MSIATFGVRNTNISTLKHLVGADITQEDQERLERYKVHWDFYKGYHYEEIAPSDSPEVTENYCAAFVNKYVAFEFGKGFNVRHKSNARDLVVKREPIPIYNEDGELTEEVAYKDTTLEEFLKQVWDLNGREKLGFEIGQSKSITGDAWVRPRYYSPDEIEDPFGEYPEGYIKVDVIPSNVVFPEYDPHNADRLIRLRIMYPVEDENRKNLLSNITGSANIYKQEFTNDTIVEVINGERKEYENEYGFIPFIQIKNFPIVGESFGRSDLDDLIPLNTELNLKKSDVSEILEYHAAPVTLIFGAKVGNLEKGANKVWGGLPKDAQVRNLELATDLASSYNHIKSIKNAMHEVGGVPEGALGGGQHISNTSGVALQIVNKPLIERTNVKRMSSKAGLERVNKMILFLAEFHGLIDLDMYAEEKHKKLTRYDKFYTEVLITDTLPKDRLMELNQIAQELNLQLEDRRGAMERLGKDNIDEKLEQIDRELEKKRQIDLAEEEREEKAKEEGRLILNKHGKPVNSMDTTLNGENPVEQVRREILQANTKDNE